MEEVAQGNRSRNDGALFEEAEDAAGDHFVEGAVGRSMKNSAYEQKLKRGNFSHTLQLTASVLSVRSHKHLIGAAVTVMRSFEEHQALSITMCTTRRGTLEWYKAAARR